MVAVNDTLKKVTVHQANVQNINGTDVYTNDDGMVIHTEKRKKFEAADKKLRAEMPKTLTPEQIKMLQENGRE